MAALDTRSLGTSKLDRGEAEAIALAVSLGPGTSILLDDLRARTAAERLGLRVTGSAGVLTEAKRLEIIPAVRPILDELQDAGLYLDRRAVSVMLEEVGE